MATQTNTDNPLGNIFQLYLNLAEQTAPVIKQGIEDWFTVYSKLWTEGFRMQSEWLKQFTGNTDSAGFTEKAKDFGEKVMEAQKNVSTDMVDTAVKGAKSFKEAARKVKTKARNK